MKKLLLALLLFPMAGMAATVEFSWKIAEPRPGVPAAEEHIIYCNGDPVGRALVPIEALVVELEDATTFFCHMNGVTAGTQGGPSKEITFETPLRAPDPPTAFGVEILEVGF